MRRLAKANSRRWIEEAVDALQKHADKSDKVSKLAKPLNKSRLRFKRLSEQREKLETELDDGVWVV